MRADYLVAATIVLLAYFLVALVPDAVGPDAVGKDAVVEKPTSRDLRIFQIGFNWDRPESTYDWIPNGLLIHETGKKKPAAGPFKTTRPLKEWIKSLPPSSIVRYDAGCVVEASLAVGQESISIEELKKLCKKRNVEFELLVGW